MSQHVLLELVLDHLRDALALDASVCYEALDPLDPPTLPKGGDYFIVVGFGPSVFAQDLQAGTSWGQCCEQCSLLVVPYTRIKTDSTDHGYDLLTSSTRGALTIKQWVLKALVGTTFESELGGTFLRQTIYARSAARPRVVTSTRLPIGLLCLPLEFGLDFDWEILPDESSVSSSTPSSTSTVTTSASTTSLTTTTSVGSSSSSSSVGTSTTVSTSSSRGSSSSTTSWGSTSSTSWSTSTSGAQSSSSSSVGSSSTTTASTSRGTSSTSSSLGSSSTTSWSTSTSHGSSSSTSSVQTTSTTTQSSSSSSTSTTSVTSTTSGA